MRVWGNTQSLIISISSPPKEPWYLKPKITNNGEIKISNQEEKSGVQKMRELHEEIRKSLKPSKELIDALIKTGKIKPKDQTDKKVARPFTPEAGA